MALYEFEKIAPKVDPTAFVADGAVVLGDIVIGADSSIWYGVVLRGDAYPIRIGKRTNIQDLSVGHITGGNYDLNIGDEVTIGHGAVIHGCTIHDRCLIGMGAVVLDGAEIGAETIIGAGAVIAPNTQIPPRHLAVGIPAKVKRELTEEEITFLSLSAEEYVELAKRHKQGTLLCK